MKKIQNSLFLICEKFGEKIDFDGAEFHTFPTFEKINNLDKLIETKCGYRAKYIYNTCQYLKENNNFLDDLSKLNLDESVEELRKLQGVGEKVALCICLFALNHYEAFPIDTWIKQIIEKIYLKREANLKEIKEFIENHFGENKGIAQQYLFIWAKENLK